MKWAPEICGVGAGR